MYVFVSAFDLADEDTFDVFAVVVKGVGAPMVLVEVVDVLPKVWLSKLGVDHEQVKHS